MSSPLERMADFDLSDEQRQVRSFVKEFAEKEILPHVEQYEREAKYPLDLIEKLVPLGLMGPMIPEQYGGSFTDVMVTAPSTGTINTSNLPIAAMCCGVKR